jgi:hypothetical protein
MVEMPMQTLQQTGNADADIAADWHWLFAQIYPFTGVVVYQQAWHGPTDAKLCSLHDAAAHLVDRTCSILRQLTHPALLLHAPASTRPDLRVFWACAWHKSHL